MVVPAAHMGFQLGDMNGLGAPRLASNARLRTRQGLEERCHKTRLCPVRDQNRPASDPNAWKKEPARYRTLVFVPTCGANSPPTGACPSRMTNGVASISGPCRFDSSSPLVETSAQRMARDGRARNSP